MSSYELRKSDLYISSLGMEMTQENIKWLETVFRRTVGENKFALKKDFKKILKSKNVSTLSQWSPGGNSLMAGLCIFLLKF